MGKGLHTRRRKSICTLSGAHVSAGQTGRAPKNKAAPGPDWERNKARRAGSEARSATRARKETSKEALKCFYQPLLASPGLNSISPSSPARGGGGSTGTALPGSLHSGKRTQRSPSQHTPRHTKSAHRCSVDTPPTSSRRYMPRYVPVYYEVGRPQTYLPPGHQASPTLGDYPNCQVSVAKRRSPTTDRGGQAAIPKQIVCALQNSTPKLLQKHHRCICQISCSGTLPDLRTWETQQTYWGARGNRGYCRSGR